tara:strand:+ start:973 stop:1086 length:114 start_codon:yes stop_codon:yes gene_type:complete
MTALVLLDLWIGSTPFLVIGVVFIMSVLSVYLRTVRA